MKYNQQSTKSRREERKKERKSYHFTAGIRWFRLGYIILHHFQIPVKEKGYFKNNWITALELLQTHELKLSQEVLENRNCTASINRRELLNSISSVITHPLELSAVKSYKTSQFFTHGSFKFLNRNIRWRSPAINFLLSNATFSTPPF